MSRPPRFARPGLKDWLLLAIGVAFVVMGLLSLPHKPNVGIVTIAFFGSCAVAAGHTVLRKRADSRADLRWAGLVGGVPIRPSRTGVWLLSLWLTILGAILVIFATSYPTTLRAIAWLILLIGAGMSFACARGWIPAGHLQFDPEGITIAGRKRSYLVPWDRIAAVSPGDMYDNPALFVFLNGVDGIRTEPPEDHEKTLKGFETSEAWAGAPIVVMTGLYKLPLPALVAALERYVADPSARAELAQRRLPP